MNSAIGIIVFLVFSIVLRDGYAYNKYSEDLNNRSGSDAGAKDKLQRPFRMQKINLLWEKANQRLSPQKLKNLHNDLTIQDKEELMLKKLKAEGKDKDGLKESELRKKLNTIIKKYELGEHFKSVEGYSHSPDDPRDTTNQFHKQVFRDKKLNKLWMKAEQVGFTDEQLKMLKEEFQHQQEKIDQYYQIVNSEAMKRSTNDVDEASNSIEAILEGESVPDKKESTYSPHQLLQEKHQELKQGYEKLTGFINDDKFDSKDFEEPQAQKLWNLANQADFTKSELESLKEELKHFEHRLKKLKFLEADLELAKNRNPGLSDKDDGPHHLKMRVKDLGRKVEKLHAEFETRIMQRHLEL